MRRLFCSALFIRHVFLILLLICMAYLARVASVYVVFAVSIRRRARFAVRLVLFYILIIHTRHMCMHMHMYMYELPEPVPRT